MKDHRFDVGIVEMLLRELEGEIFGELFDGKPRGGLIWLGCSFHLESEWLGRWIEPQENVSDFQAVLTGGGSTVDTGDDITFAKAGQAIPWYRKR